jgi:5-methylcytosine-specific restriction endonuclease McrA
MATSAAIAKSKAAEMLEQQNNTLEFCPTWNDTLGADWNAQRVAVYEAARFERMAAVDDERIEHTERYQNYLQTPQWRLKRRLVLERSEGRCEGCRACAATEVHHLTYKHVFNELLFELVALCRECHERAHS